MGLQPKIAPLSTTTKCFRCGGTIFDERAVRVRSPFYPDGVLPLCADCIDALICEHKGDWDYIDKLCQMVDVPFVPREWERLGMSSQVRLFKRYAATFLEEEYAGLGWHDYYEEFLRLKEEGRLDEEVPLVQEDHLKALREKWGANYDPEALHYLEDLFNGLMATQNVNGALQIDQAKKICKMSYEVDRRIAEGDDFDKLLASYDKLVKAAEFTPKNVKNVNDFDTVGELIKWLEKTGWENSYYDNVPKDIVDETIADIQAFNQRLYTNESGIGDEINQRIAALRQADQLERGDYYLTKNDQVDLDNFEVAAYNGLWDDADDTFNPGGVDE